MRRTSDVWHGGPASHTLTGLREQRQLYEELWSSIFALPESYTSRNPNHRVGMEKNEWMGHSCCTDEFINSTRACTFLLLLG